MSPLIKVNYVTSSEFKKQENDILAAKGLLNDGTPISSIFQFAIRKLRVPEMLLIDVESMVKAEVTHAYGQIRVPCVVEHTGLIFEDLEAKGYPGGLTKPTWNALAPQFLAETHSAGRRTIARAVVAYCDGQRVRTFIGETRGTLADAPRGKRDFYWDNVFIPDDPSAKAKDRTYAEIVDDPALGLEYKVLSLSQSTKAMMQLLEYLRESGTPDLWR
jgi:inosine/xanthosine triphosphate pyrophosphatase family protein